MIEHFHEMPVIEIQVAWCQPHWAQFQRRLPPRSMAMATFKLWEQLMADVPFAKVIGSWREPPETWVMASDFTLLNETMRTEPYMPWCCYIGPERREKAWEVTPFISLPKES